MMAVLIGLINACGAGTVNGRYQPNLYFGYWHLDCDHHHNDIDAKSFDLADTIPLSG